MNASPVSAWLAQVRHDLVKRVAWSARDLVATAAPSTDANLALLKQGLQGLVDEEGTPLTAEDLWAHLRAQAPAGVPVERLDAFGLALAEACAAVRAVDAASYSRVLHQVLDVERAWESLRAGGP